MEQPKGIAVVLGVLFGLVVVGVVVGGILLFKSESKNPILATNTNTALQLECSVDSDCSSYCGVDPCYQPICGVTTIGAAGSCTCRSTCGPIAPGGNTNAAANTNATVNVNAKISCEQITDESTCSNRTDCLTINTCRCSTTGERYRKCGLGVRVGCMCNSAEAGFERCEALVCPVTNVNGNVNANGNTNANANSNSNSSISFDTATALTLAKDFLRSQAGIVPEQIGEASVNTYSGKYYVTFSQQVNAIPVHGADATVVVYNNRSASLLKSFFQSISSVAGATIDEQTAKNYIVRSLQKDSASTQATFNDAKVVIYPQLDSGKNIFYTAWQIDVRTENPFGSWRYFIDATNGNIIKRDNMIVE